MSQQKNSLFILAILLNFFQTPIALEVVLKNSNPILEAAFSIDSNETWQQIPIKFEEKIKKVLGDFIQSPISFFDFLEKKDIILTVSEEKETYSEIIANEMSQLKPRIKKAFEKVLKFADNCMSETKEVEDIIKTNLIDTLDNFFSEQIAIKKKELLQKVFKKGITSKESLSEVFIIDHLHSITNELKEMLRPYYQCIKKRSIILPNTFGYINYWWFCIKQWFKSAESKENKYEADSIVLFEIYQKSAKEMDIISTEIYAISSFKKNPVRELVDLHQNLLKTATTAMINETDELNPNIEGFNLILMEIKKREDQNHKNDVEASFDVSSEHFHAICAGIINNLAIEHLYKVRNYQGSMDRTILQTAIKNFMQHLNKNAPNSVLDSLKLFFEIQDNIISYPLPANVLPKFLEDHDFSKITLDFDAKSFKGVRNMVEMRYFLTFSESVQNDDYINLQKDEKNKYLNKILTAVINNFEAFLSIESQYYFISSNSELLFSDYFIDSSKEEHYYDILMFCLNHFFTADSKFFSLINFSKDFNFWFESSDMNIKMSVLEKTKYPDIDLYVWIVKMHNIETSFRKFALPMKMTFDKKTQKDLNVLSSTLAQWFSNNRFQKVKQSMIKLITVPFEGLLISGDNVGQLVDNMAGESFDVDNMFFSFPEIIHEETKLTFSALFEQFKSRYNEHKFDGKVLKMLKEYGFRKVYENKNKVKKSDEKEENEDSMKNDDQYLMLSKTMINFGEVISDAGFIQEYEQIESKLNDEMAMDLKENFYFYRDLRVKVAELEILLNMAPKMMPIVFFYGNSDFQSYVFQQEDDEDFMHAFQLEERLYVLLKKHGFINFGAFTDMRKTAIKEHLLKNKSKVLI